MTPICNLFLERPSYIYMEWRVYFHC